MAIDERQGEGIADRQGVGEADEREERIDRQQAGRRNLRKGRRSEQNRTDDGANENQPPDSALQAVDRAYLPGVPMYGAVFVVAFFSPLAAVFLTFAIAAFYLPSAALFDR